MNSTLFEEDGHLTKISLKALKEGYLSDDELVLISEHMCMCARCADSLADSFCEDELAIAPLGFHEEILSKIERKKEKNTQFLFYSLRVAMAASIALIFVFSNALNLIANTKIEPLNIAPMSLNTTNTINKSLNDFSQKIIHLEVFNNENEKK
ncbi:hypothetical protein LGK97_15450 [Clostridium sp. CS001]|uniref:hypothetical protein n=1 Tax=Clostridium sp. CS001 TaxID=2880648 RepID=UPI001CF15886|nr:hypothetical protein [Clostridium sp. CS001]MCB2291126.1 hypothetical protein [Clostridium sp. CS001]